MSDVRGLKFMVPDVPDSYDGYNKVSLIISAVDGVLGFFETAVIGTSIGFGAMLVTGPLAAWVGSFAALGDGYAAGRKMVTEDNMARGYSRGAVMGIHGRTGHTVVNYFGHEQFFNTFDQEAAISARNGYTAGLLVGFREGSELRPGQKKLLLRDLEQLSGLRWGQSQHNNERAAANFYRDLAVTFRRFHLSE